MAANWAAASGAHLPLEDIDWGSGDAENMFTSSADDLLISDPRAVRRAETAPMILTIMGTDGSLCVGGFEEEVNPDEEYRYTEEYHRLYYSKNPRDPRMLPPLTRRRQHLERETRSSGVLAASSGDKHPVFLTNGAVGDRVDAQGSELAAAVAISTTAAAATTTTTATPSLETTVSLSSQELVQLYIDRYRPDWDYAQIRTHICTFSRDQDGSRLVQRLLEKPKNVVPIFNEVIDAFGELATEVFGNYVLQKLFDVVPRVENDPNASQEIKEARLMDRLTEKVRGHLLEYSLQTYGCRVMQKAVENMRAADRAIIIRELDGKIVDSVFDQNANHVVQKVIEVCPAEVQFVVDAFLPSLGELACHAYGCRVLQRTFERCHDVAGVDIRPLLEAVLIRVNEFTVHQYGNYVVQHAMLNAPEDLRHRFVVQLTPQLYALSCSKFASNVAERIVTTATEEERDAIINELKKPLSDFQGVNLLVNMMQDTYANYVVQRFFEVVSARQCERISELVQPYIISINQSVYGRHLLRKLVSNNILSNTLLLGHGIDVSGPDYGGSANTGGYRGGGHRNIANGTSGNDNRHNGGGATTYANRNGNGREYRGGGSAANGSGGRAGLGGRVNNPKGNHHNQHSDSGNITPNSCSSGNPNSMLMLQQQLQLQQQLVSGYMPMPQQYQYSSPYGIPQLAQQQPQAPQQGYMYPAAAAGPQVYPPQQALVPQIAPGGFGAFPGAAAFPVPMQPQQQAGNYDLRYVNPVQQMTPPSQQLQRPTRCGGAQSSQAYVNGGYSGPVQGRLPLPQGSCVLPASQQQALQMKGASPGASLSTGKGSRSSKGNTSTGVSSSGTGSIVSVNKDAALLTKNTANQQQQMGF
ncbi:hypothetical protein JKF63_06621 [Porcisia hertigi]|uniref:PUM-HD domain-containing protein n=1 Tax=Porcisia hertigi TaxID=2761500 RepID=A0A836HXP3_9TRYP|nr:hypothetical protein JKF63_06621 [Porcisia hertigi]